MTYNATALEIIIASPSDVDQERQVVREVIANWNAVHARDRQIVLMPVGWETHASPDLSDRPQQLINDRLLKHADILVGIFWTRIGSPTGKAISGSVEEIEEHRRQGKPVMLYFSTAPAHPDSIDPAQYGELKRFKEWARMQGLVWPFDNAEHFRALFTQQLPLTLRDNSYLQPILAKNAATTGPLTSTLTRYLSEEAVEMLQAAASEVGNGMIMVIPTLSGTMIQSGQRPFGQSDSARDIAKWEAAVDQLLDHALIKDLNGKHQSFKVTNEGYKHVEKLNGL